MMRARSEANRRRALEAYLRSLTLTYEDYCDLERVARRPFYVSDTGRIYLPAVRLLDCLVNACASAPARLRIPNLRVALRPTDFVTTKTAPDGVWERFVVVTGAQGKLSNQRGFRSNAYIEQFTATGTIAHDPELVRPEAILALLAYAGREVGIGASRKMGWGRFRLEGEGE